MITIITGVPGMGKTALLVSMMMEEHEKNEKAGEPLRPFFVMGVPDLQIDHSPVPPVIEWTEKRPDKDDPSVELDYFTFPKNSIICIDEAQRVYRPRASTSKVPPHVAAHETHRHTGVDFWLLTQKPSLIDSNIRDLCGRHIHIKQGLFGRWLYEWTEYTDVKVKGNYEDASKRKFSPPKKAFTKYKSAELHTKQPRRFHQVFIVLALAVAFTGYNGFNVYHKFSSKTSGEPIAKNDNASDRNIAVGTLAPQPSIATAPSIQPVKYEQPPVEHPYQDFEFIIVGQITSPSRDLTYYRLMNDKGRVVDTNSEELSALGYEIRQSNYCSAFLFYHGVGIVASCSRQADAPRGGSVPTTSAFPNVL
jgi:zona occludens toxin